ncbi:hypothetical protein G3I76_42880, partial [Streptomyces sp. SID11233]|nr:hypothetical protein [Streptomyces sp. SID11233]
MLRSVRRRPAKPRRPADNLFRPSPTRRTRALTSVLVAGALAGSVLAATPAPAAVR